MAQKLPVQDFFIVQGGVHYWLLNSKKKLSAHLYSICGSRAQLRSTHAIQKGRKIYFRLDRNDFLIEMLFHGVVLQCRRFEDNVFSIDIDLDNFSAEQAEAMRSSLFKRGIPS